MKKLLALFFILASFSSFAQISKMGGMATRVNDSTAYVTSPTVIQAHTDGYADIWFSNSSDLFWVWNGSAYVNWDPSASGGVTLYSGDGTLAGDREVNGGNNNFAMNNVHVMEWYADTVFMEGFDGNGIALTEKGVHINANADTINFSGTVWEINTALGTDGHVPTVQSDGSIDWGAGVTNTSTSLTDAGTITITGPKHTLTSDEATITWTLSQIQDFQTTDIILNATSTTWTFPANTLCVVDGVASGNNTAALSGTSGDHHIMSIYKDSTNYRVVVKNFGQ